MLRVLAVAAALVFSTAEAQISDKMARKLLTDVNVETLTPILQSQGMFPETQTIAGQQTLVLSSADQIIMLRPRVCNPDCSGLLMYVILEGSTSGQDINSFNQETPPTMVYTRDGNTVLSRYIIADHGITAGTFLVNLGVFDSTVAKWIQGRTVSNRFSVSLRDDSPIDSYDPETEAFLDEAFRRPELISGRHLTEY